MTIAFDLDDTLYKEKEFVGSAFRHIASEYGAGLLDLMTTASTPAEAFDRVVEAVPSLTIEKVLGIYRNHRPDIRLDDETESVLKKLADSGHTLAIITDGRIITQSNKICALGLDRFVSPELIFISEKEGYDKLSPHSFLKVMERSGKGPFCYVGDNPRKDFIMANKLGWTTVMLRDNGANIHSQAIKGLTDEYLPDITISRIGELTDLEFS